MADVRTARRNAEKAARDALAGTLVGAAGELGAARATQQEAGAGVAAAAEKGRQVVEADTGYASAWQGARDAGWAPAQLRGMGYPAPTASASARRRTATRDRPEKGAPSSVALAS